MSIKSVVRGRLNWHSLGLHVEGRTLQIEGCGLYPVDNREPRKVSEEEHKMIRPKTLVINLAAAHRMLGSGEEEVRKQVSKNTEKRPGNLSDNKN